MLYTLFFPSKSSLFHNFNVFGSCIIHILYTGCAKIKKKSGVKRITERSLDKMQAVRKYAVEWHLEVRQFILATRDWCWGSNTKRRSGTTLHNDSTLRVLATNVVVHEQIRKQNTHTCWNVAWIPAKLFTPKPVKFQLQEKLQLEGAWNTN